MTIHTSLPRWGIVSTIKAEARQILTFAAYHLEQGAHRVCIYLDAPCPEAFDHLKAHPKVRVIDCDAAYWKRQPRERPDAHQLRQTYNANRAYRKQCKDLDWLAHIDADEFLTAPDSVASQLAHLPPEALTARVRPAEVLEGSDRFFRRALRGSEGIRELSQTLYPRWGAHFSGGMLSHRAGKIFVRAGVEGMKLRIHRSFIGDLQNPCEVDLDEMDLCHFHARDWNHWYAHYRYRHENGTYRAALKPTRSISKTAQTKHAVMAEIEAKDGLAGLQALYQEFCENSLERRAILHKFGLLLERDLRLDQGLCAQFPAFHAAVAQRP